MSKLYCNKCGSEDIRVQRNCKECGVDVSVGKSFCEDCKILRKKEYKKRQNHNYYLHRKYFNNDEVD